MDELQERIAEHRRLIAAGERPLYHATATYDGSAVDVRVRELPIIHLFVPDTTRVLDGARGLIARTLGVGPSSFEVTAAAQPAAGPPPPSLEPRRCWWPAGVAGVDGLMVAYHDEEWGSPIDDDTALFERLALEGFQAGLSWATILRKRAAFRRAFGGFDPATVAAFGAADRARLLADASIVRNRAKIEATIDNARLLLELVHREGSFAAYLHRMLPREAPIRPSGPGPSMLPARTEESDALSADLRRRGFRFAGSTIVYAFMQSVGLVDDHVPGCFRYRG